MFQECGLEELWIEFGIGDTSLYTNTCSRQKHGRRSYKGTTSGSWLLVGIRSSPFAGKGKKTVWNVLVHNPEAIQTFNKLNKVPNEKDLEECTVDVERLTVLLYDRSSDSQTINEAQRKLFPSKVRSLVISYNQTRMSYYRSYYKPGTSTHIRYYWTIGGYLFHHQCINLL